ncbi:hypothetical protein [Myceligenerans crystallogenes]|uniref:EspG family protein n=1 Tax=Myceligenerans crystallogenes TaxID=316335 RepID=A0ABN2NFV8_9MICO
MGTDGWTFHVQETHGWIVVPRAGALPPGALAAWESTASDVIAEAFDDGVVHDDVAPSSAAGAAAAEQHDAVIADLRRQAATASVANLRAFADGVAEAGAVVAATYRVPGTTPAPVLVVVGVEPPGDPGDDLMEALGATGGTAIAPPRIEHLDLPDGDGMRVTRLDLDPATGAARISICLGRRTEHPDAVVDTVIQWRSQELLYAPAMTELLDDLLPAVRITRSAE